MDVAILHLPVVGALLSWPFYEDDYVLVVPEPSKVIEQPVETWEPLTSQPLLLPMTCVSCNRLLHTYLDQHVATALTVLEVENDSAMLGMVAHGLGHAIIPQLATLPLPAGLRVMALPIPLKRHLAVAVVPSRAGLPMIHALTTLLRDQALLAASTQLSWLPG